MRIKFTLYALLFLLTLKVYGQQSQDFEIKKDQVSRPKQFKGQKSKPVLVKKNKLKKGKPFIPSEEVSPDIPVSFPADI